MAAPSARRCTCRCSLRPRPAALPPAAAQTGRCTEAARRGRLRLHPGCTQSPRPPPGCRRRGGGPPPAGGGGQRGSRAASSTWWDWCWRFLARARGGSHRCQWQEPLPQARSAALRRDGGGARRGGRTRPKSATATSWPAGKAGSQAAHLHAIHHDPLKLLLHCSEINRHRNVAQVMVGSRAGAGGAAPQRWPAGDSRAAGPQGSRAACAGRASGHDRTAAAVDRAPASAKAMKASTSAGAYSTSTCDNGQGQHSSGESGGREQAPPCGWPASMSGAAASSKARPQQQATITRAQGTV